MARKIRYSAGVWAFTEAADRFCSKGYRDPLDTRAQFEMAGTVPGLEGFIIQCPNVINESNAAEIKKLAADNGLEIASVDANLFSREFKYGALSNADRKIRQQAIALMKKTIDMAAETGCNETGCWLGQDGFDYSFQENYMEAWNRIRDAIAECADYNPRVRIGVEYKVSEPRAHLFINSAGKAMALCYEIGKDNVGVTCDIGHVYMNKEKPAEAVSYLAQRDKLFSMHFNDAYGCFDDDLMAGTVHIWDTIEVLYYLEQFNYSGWYGFDIFPYREDPSKAVEISLKNIDALRKIALKIDPEILKQKQSRGDSIETQEYIRDFVLGHVE